MNHPTPEILTKLATQADPASDPQLAEAQAHVADCPQCLTKSAVSKRYKTIKNDPEYAEEAEVLLQWITLDKQQSGLKKTIKDAEAELDQLAHNKYPQLSEDEVKELVVEDKWLAALESTIHSETDRISQTLIQRVKELADRYETPLPQMTDRVAALEEKVNAHLERMGFVWK